MKSISIEDLSCVVGGLIPGPCSGGSSLRCPIGDPQSEFGRMVDDVARGLNDFGSWLGGEIYDATH